jgi:hypothetical protein
MNLTGSAPDIGAGLRAAGGQYATYQALMSVLFQASYGPWEGGRWWRQAKEKMTEWVNGAGKVDALIFRRELPKVAFDRGEDRSVTLNPDWVQRRFEELGPDRYAVGVAGKRLNCSRFGSFWDCFPYWDTVWHLRGICWLLLGLSPGYVDCNTKSKALQLRDAAGRAGAEAKGSKQIGTRQAKKSAVISEVRSKATHHLHMATLIILMDGLQRWGRLMSTAVVPFRKQSGLQAKSCKGPASNLKYFADQVGGKCLDAILEALQGLYSMVTQRHCGFRVVENDMPKS